MTQPVRTCIGCRARAPKSALLRLVWRGSAVQVDHRQIEPGRGAYLHPRAECVDQAAQRRAVGRALRVTGADSTLESVRMTLEPTGESTPSTRADSEVRG